MADTELKAEQAYVDRVYDRLETIRNEALRSRERVFAIRPHDEQAHVEREALYAETQARAARLSIGDEPVVFGRLDFADGETIYLGRVGVTDEDHTPLVVDWRAPAAEPFYRATGREPMSVARRRHFHCRGRRVLALDDELLDSDAAEGLELVGEAALLRTIERTRTGRMQDIVGTIQAEQDAVIRWPLEGVLVVEGGPGTGKTIVGLHRAAYLLYTHRRRLERTGVLLVGPTPVFLRYIEHVLPSLGEETVRLATAAQLVDDLAVRGTDTPTAARLKGDPRMIKVIRRAVADRPQPIDEPLRILYDGELVELTPAQTERIVADVKAAPGTHNGRRRVVQKRLLQRLLRTYRSELERSYRAGSRGPRSKMSRDERADFYADMLDDERVRASIGAMWPTLTPRRLLGDLLTDEERLERAATGVLDPDEWAELLRQKNAWTAADVALLDEASVALGSHRAARSAGGPLIDEEERWGIERMMDDLQEVDPIIASEREMFVERYVKARRDLEDSGDDRPARETFGQIVVDEAQDLSPMQVRMIGRRSFGSSLTILGDLGQAAGVWSVEAWSDLLPYLRARGEPTHRELTINYRTPAEIMDVADRMLVEAGYPRRRTRSVRATGASPVVDRTSERELVAAVARLARDERERTEGTVGVIAPRDLVEPLNDVLGASDVVDILEAPVAVLSVPDAKGLEFDVAVVVEPSAIVEEAGMRGLYVSLSRPTQALLIVHADDLPPALKNSLR